MALAAQGLTSRPTQDLDLFTAPGRGIVLDALAGLESAVIARGWSVRRVRVAETFARIVVGADAEGESVLVDLAVDATPERPPMLSLAGPTLDPDELAGRKVAALFDLVEARDFADVYALAARYGTERLLELAAAVDAGFDVGVFADMLDSLARFTDDERSQLSTVTHPPSGGSRRTGPRGFGAARRLRRDWVRTTRFVA
ncbi:MAG: nucleotidyl transferase AbiEii/AbiGii toxin family protein [Kineosporiaceae bacterium]